ncbi:MAG TPA: MFS transporter [Burkholderiales bacterium]|nr:MFS transporter [Burkholderiales bacterium]
MHPDRDHRMELPVFALVAAAFTTIYITQPVLPVLQAEFGISAGVASLTVSAVVLGIALANLPFGMAADRYPIRPILLGGGTVVGIASLVCAFTPDITVLVAARFVQGLFIPSLTTCLAAYLARTLPAERLNVAMGSYVAATVAGGLGGRLLGGWIHPPLHWRYAFVSAAVFLALATLASARWLDRGPPRTIAEAAQPGFLELLGRPELRRMCAVAFGGFFVFSSVFNFLPFHLTAPPIGASTEVITLMYLAYVVGIFTGPQAGRLANRVGNGSAMVLGAALLALSLGVTLVRSLPVIALGLAGVCAGFFTIHASAVGLLNRRLTAAKGRANSLYVLFYYLGGAAGITLSGYAYAGWGWGGVAALNGGVLALPFAIGMLERRAPSRI